MARKKDLKPLLATKHDFVESLDNVVQQSINIITTCEQLIEMEQIKTPGLAAMLQERVTAFRAAIFNDE